MSRLKNDYAEHQEAGQDQIGHVASHGAEAYQARNVPHAEANHGIKQGARNTAGEESVKVLEKSFNSYHF